MAADTKEKHRNRHTGCLSFLIEEILTNLKPWKNGNMPKDVYMDRFLGELKRPLYVKRSFLFLKRKYAGGIEGIKYIDINNPDLFAKFIKEELQMYRRNSQKEVLGGLLENLGDF